MSSGFYSTKSGLDNRTSVSISFAKFRLLALTGSLFDQLLATVVSFAVPPALRFGRHFPVRSELHRLIFPGL
jgi:hypothetical protein